MSKPITEHEGKKYLRVIRSCVDGVEIQIDIYDVLEAYDVKCQAIAHAIKKLLCAGTRGKGDKLQDLVGAEAAISRAIELEQSRQSPAPLTDAAKEWERLDNEFVKAQRERLKRLRNQEDKPLTNEEVEKLKVDYDKICDTLLKDALRNWPDIKTENTTPTTYGVPRMKPVIDKIVELKKITEASGESYFKETAPEFTEKEVVPPEIKAIDDYGQQLIQFVKEHWNHYALTGLDPAGIERDIKKVIEDVRKETLQSLIKSPEALKNATPVFNVEKFRPYSEERRIYFDMINLPLPIHHQGFTFALKDIKLLTQDNWTRWRSKLIEAQTTGDKIKEAIAQAKLNEIESYLLAIKEKEEKKPNATTLPKTEWINDPQMDKTLGEVMKEKGIDPERASEIPIPEVPPRPHPDFSYADRVEKVKEVVEQTTIGVESNLRYGIDVPIPELIGIGCSPVDWLGHQFNTGSLSCDSCGIFIRTFLSKPKENRPTCSGKKFDGTYPDAKKVADLSKESTAGRAEGQP